MSLPLAGDAASCSQAGGALRQLAARLRVAGRAAHDTFDGRGAPRGGGFEAAARRRVEGIDAAAATATLELDHVGAALQAHATDLAEAQAAARRLATRAEAAGLRLREGTLTPAWGVTGLADPDASAAQDSIRLALQSELDSILGTLGQRRQRLLTTVRQAESTLHSHAGALRR
jgi:hypothetical protein